MKMLFMIGHPAHFHLFRQVFANLKRDGFDVTVVIRPKDVLEQLCVNDGLDYIKVKERSRMAGKLAIAISLVWDLWETLSIIKQKSPELLVGSGGVLAYAGRICGIPSIHCDEDDANATPLFAKMFYPFFTWLITPYNCDVGKWENKRIGVHSYHELAYLHPNHFKPEPSYLRKYGISTDKPFFIVRFAQLTAYHDVGIQGISDEIAIRLVSILKRYGTVFVSSERQLCEELEPYRLHINPLDIHHIMAFSSLFVGDSQTMAAEAGVLGVPFVRLNDFSGRLSYLNEIENKYRLGYSHKTNDLDGFFSSVQKWLDTPNRKAICAERRGKMLADTIDYAKFLTWFIENYPKSEEVMRNDPDYQWRFR